MRYHPDGESDPDDDRRADQCFNRRMPKLGLSLSPCTPLPGGSPVLQGR